jgi:MoxR-like ATPase
VRIEMGLPAPEAELDLYRKAVAGELVDFGGSLPATVLRPGEALALRRASRRVHVADELLGYLAQLAAGVRRSPQVDLPVSPRAALALLEAGRAGALLEGRDFLIPDDLKRLLVPAWAHRILLTPEAELEGFNARRILEGVAAAVPVPH